MLGRRYDDREKKLSRVKAGRSGGGIGSSGEAKRVRSVFTQTLVSSPPGPLMKLAGLGRRTGYSDETSDRNYTIKGSRLITANKFYLRHLPTPGGTVRVAHAQQQCDETVVTTFECSRCGNTVRRCS